MAQFDVYPHPVKEMRDSYPYVLQIQSAFLKRPIGIITVPLAFLEPGSGAVAILNPRFEIAGATVVLETLATVSFEPGDLRRPVANLRSDADAIWSALDYALHGY
ncbi:MAG: CcdB family protein [Polaromonas sp.]